MLVGMMAVGPNTRGEYVWRRAQSAVEFPTYQTCAAYLRPGLSCVRRP